MKRPLSFLVLVTVALLALLAPTERSAQATGTKPLAAWLYANALTMEHSWAPGETEPEYLTRAGTIAEALAEAARPYADGRGWTATELTLAVLVLMNEETKFDARIHAGTGHPIWNEDHGKAKCLGQGHASKLLPPAEWAKLAGTDMDATLRCAIATTRIWVAQARQCGVWWGVRADRTRIARTMNAYATGGNCKPADKAWTRADKWLSRIAKRPDRGPVRGYRRALPSELNQEARELVGIASGALTLPGSGLGKRIGTSDGQFLAVVEHHAEGKIGVSMMVRESAGL